MRVFFTPKPYYSAFLRVLAESDRFFSSPPLIFNLTFQFELNLNSTTIITSLDLFHTKETLIRLNALSSRIEIIVDDPSLPAAASIAFNRNSSNTSHWFSLALDNETMALSLDSSRLRFASLTDYFELFSSEYIEMTAHNHSLLTINQVYLNEHRLAMCPNGSSKQYVTHFITPNTQAATKSTAFSTRRTWNAHDTNTKSSQNVITLFASSWNHPTPVLIVLTVSVMLVFMLVALVTIVVSICVRGRARKQSNTTTQTTNSTSSLCSELARGGGTHVNYFQYEDSSSIGLDHAKKTTSKLAHMTSRLGSFLKKSSIEKCAENCHSQANLIMSFNSTTNAGGQRNQLNYEASNEKRFLFDQNDLCTLKDTLNWTPSFELYKSVFSDMEAFDTSKIVNEATSSDGVLVLESNLMAVNKYGQQTFV